MARGRKSLHSKLRMQPDYQQIVEMVKTIHAPHKHIMERFGCSAPAAKKACDEIRGIIPVSDKAVQEENNTKTSVAMFLEEIGKMLAASDDTAQIFVTVGERVDKLSMRVLKEVFQSLSTFVCTGDKDSTVYAVKCLLQVKYYEKVYGQPAPDHVKAKANGAVARCAI
jgi:hypothetical protein